MSTTLFEKVLLVATASFCVMVLGNLAVGHDEHFRLLTQSEAARLFGGTAQIISYFPGKACESDPACVDAIQTTCVGTKKADCGLTRQDTSYHNGDACTKDAGEALCEQSGNTVCHSEWTCAWNFQIEICETQGRTDQFRPDYCHTTP